MRVCARVKSLLVQTSFAGHPRTGGDDEGVEAENTHHEVLCSRVTGTTENRLPLQIL